MRLPLLVLTNAPLYTIRNSLNRDNTLIRSNLKLGLTLLNEKLKDKRNHQEA